MPDAVFRIPAAVGVSVVEVFLPDNRLRPTREDGRAKHGTAEELAEDEQVRKLYLGRNFELKRKDYLHEEDRASANES